MCLLFPNSILKGKFQIKKILCLVFISSLLWKVRTGPEVIKLFSCSTQLSMKFFQLVSVKMPTIVGILTFMSGKNSILVLSEPKKNLNFLIFCTYEHLKFYAQLS